MNVDMAVGMVTGFVLVLIFVYIILKRTKKDGNAKCQYDERQELARGKGYKVGFFAMMICDFCMGIYHSETKQSIFEPFFSNIIGAFVGIAVFAVYCIWKDAYISLNENRRKVLISSGAIGIGNFLIWISNVVGTSDFEWNKIFLSTSSINLLCAILFVIVFINVLLKGIVDKREE